MEEFEQKLIRAVARTIKEDNANLEALTDKVMAEVRLYCDKHKKEYKALNDVEKQMLNNANYVLRKISRYKYTEKQLNNAIEGNLKRVPGNLADEDRREDLYNVLANLNFKCIYSNTLLVGGGQKIHLDHIIPVNLGGPTDDWNILPICGSCNSSKSDSHLLDWWDKEHTSQDEHKLVYIFEHMANRLLKSLNTKGVKVVTTLTDEQIAGAIELENKEKQKQESKNKELDIEDDFYDDFDEEVEEIKDEKIKRLDAITFLYQMLNHIKQNKQYIISQDNLNQGILDTPSEKDKQRLIDKKFKKLEKLFNSIYKQNKRLTGVKTDIQLLDEQRKMVEYIKSLDIVSYYHISYTYFDELQQMLNEGKTDKEIQEFCNSVDRAFNFTQFYNELMAYKEEFGDLLVPLFYINGETGYKLGQIINKIRRGKKALDEWNALSEEDKTKIKKPYGCFLTGDKYQQLTVEGFTWDAKSFDYEEFYNELMTYKEEFGDLLVPAKYINKKTGYKLGQTISSIRQGKKKLEWNALREEERVKTKKPTGCILLTEDKYKQLTAEGFVWDAKSFDYEEFYNELMIYKDKFGDLAVPWNYVNKATDYRLGQTVSNIRQGKKKLDEWNALSEEEKTKTKEPKTYVLQEGEYAQLEAEGFVWDATIRFDYKKFYNELMTYKEKFGNLVVPYRYVNKITGYKLGGQVNSIRTGKKALDEWNALSEEEQAKTKKPTRHVLTEEQYTELTAEGFVWEVRKKKQMVEQGLSA